MKGITINKINLSELGLDTTKKYIKTNYNEDIEEFSIRFDYIKNDITIDNSGTIYNFLITDILPDYSKPKDTEKFFNFTFME